MLIRVPGTNTTNASDKNGGMNYQSASTGPDHGALYAGKHSDKTVAVADRSANGIGASWLLIAEMVGRGYVPQAKTSMTQVHIPVKMMDLPNAFLASLAILPCQCMVHE